MVFLVLVRVVINWYFKEIGGLVWINVDVVVYFFYLSSVFIECFGDIYDLGMVKRC